MTTSSSTPPSRRKIKDLSLYLLIVQIAVLCLFPFLSIRQLQQSTSLNNNAGHDMLSPPLVSTSSSSCNTPLSPLENANNNNNNSNNNYSFKVPNNDKNNDNNNYFGACLIIMDDNHFLTEWLAYHYLRLPLRRLIVAIDPRSQTSPKDILNRYHTNGLIQTTIWYEEDYMPPNLLAKHLTMDEYDIEGLDELYLERQSQFYTRCMAILKKETVTWTAIIDTDEYILPNPNFAPVEYYNQLVLPKQTKTKTKSSNHNNNYTIFEMIQANRKRNKMMKLGCISMHRVQFGVKESLPAQVQNGTTTTTDRIDHHTLDFDGNDFSTLRWRYHDIDNKAINGKLAKCMVNLTRALYSDFVSTEVNVHRPIKKLCVEDNLRISNADSPFVVHHYAGSWEQWNYRNDFRPKRQERFDKLYELDKYVDDTIRPWLKEFVEAQGIDMAKYLLKGVGKLTPKAGRGRGVNRTNDEAT